MTNRVKISPKFQVVIPKQIRESMRLRPGETVQVLEFDNRIELIRVGPMRKIRGFVKGIDTTVVRDKDRV